MPDNEQAPITEEVIDNQETQTENPELENTEELETEETEQAKEETEEKEREEPDEEFNSDDMDFTENDTTFGIYDLSKYRDNINFDNAEAMEAFNKEAKKLEQLGFTQEQVDYMCESILGLNEEAEQPQKLTKKEVQANLKKYLTVEEQRNYAAVNNFMKEKLKGTELEKNQTEIMSNAYLVKLGHIFYKAISGGKVINKANVKQGQNIQYTTEKAQAQYEKYLKENPDTSREDKMKFLTNLYKKMPEKEQLKFEDAFNGLFNK